MTHPITGVYSAAATPLNADLSPNLPAFAAHCHWLLEQGCNGIALLGTTGEANSFSVLERQHILDAALSAGIAPDQLMPGTGLPNIPETIALTRHALSQGVTRVVMLPPFYYKPVSDEGLFAAYARVIEGVADSRLNIVLYHIPQVAGLGISHDLIDRLRTAFPDTVVGIKDSAGKIENMEGMIARFPGFSVLAGADPLLLPVMQMGGAGCITATSNIVARDLAIVYAGANDPAQADAVAKAQDRINAFRNLSNSYVQIPAIKAMVGHVWDDPAWARTRPPLVAMSQAEQADLATKLAPLNTPKAKAAA
ncbi:dihydrodipicolinate synthase family protein [Neogemmobacter tilapiae]|uniref:Dihydrodipicolinate synthase family protein n=1 Tax=Neogemmobacter tilapiae TaxID=875041 RepID=A0A918TUJ7_9RHOB|nr:dihydrodipicolinate synthase family protein [Gemmobacter tilapiae]GHC59552.1 dihydrodipicolinate synthase family protein [Gemmobacter tilapiae]